ncbi:MAG: transposase [Hyphomicrobiaceae bacterium]
MPRVIELRADNEWLGPVLDPLLAVHASLAKQLKTVSASAVIAARGRRCSTHDDHTGCGCVTALAFKAAIDDPKRFSLSTKVGPYLGLTPRQDQSGESEWIGGIGKSNDPLLRSYLYEAAGALMARLRRTCPLQEEALRLAKRIGWKRASIAVARKLANILHAIWRNGTVFEWADHWGPGSLSQTTELPRERKASLPGQRAD